MRIFESIIQESSKDTLFDLSVKMYNFNGKQDTIQKWYLQKYRSDELGKEINPKYTFGNAMVCLMNGDDIYDLLGVNDSVVRERVFSRLAELMKIDYDVIYNTWNANKSLLRTKQDMKGWNPLKNKWR